MSIFMRISWKMFDEILQSLCSCPPQFVKYETKLRLSCFKISYFCSKHFTRNSTLNLPTAWLPVSQFNNRTRDCDLIQMRVVWWLHWRHYECVDVSNRQRLDCLRSRLFRRRSKKTSKLSVTGLYDGNTPVTGGFPSQRASNTDFFPFDDVIVYSRSAPGRGGDLQCLLLRRCSCPRGPERDGTTGRHYWRPSTVLAPRCHKPWEVWAELRSPWRSTDGGVPGPMHSKFSLINQYLNVLKFRGEKRIARSKKATRCIQYILTITWICVYIRIYRLYQKSRLWLYD